MTKTEMIEEFQCPGCTVGGPGACDKLNIEDECLSPCSSFSCKSHSAGTFMVGLGRIALGLPKGFNRYGPGDRLDIRLFLNGEAPEWDHLNVPVWAMEMGGFLFVRTYSPRINRTSVDVIENGTLDMAKNAIDVSKFVDQID